MNTARDSEDYFPAAPVLPVNLAVPGEQPAGDEFLALVDTGADGTFVPTAILEELDSQISYMTNARSHLGGNLFRVPVHKVDLILFGSLLLPTVEVVADDWGDRIILGRNVLNLLKVHLDGPARQISMKE